MVVLWTTEKQIIKCNRLQFVVSPDEMWDDFYSAPVLWEFNQVGGEYRFMKLLSLDILNSKSSYK